MSQTSAAHLFDGDGSRAQLLLRWREMGLHADDTFPLALAAGRDQYHDKRMVFYSADACREYSVAELYERSERLAGALYRMGIRSGDVVAIQVPNWVEGYLMFQATMQLGAVVLPIIHIYGAQEVGYILRESGARLLIAPDRWRNVDYLERIAQIEDVPALEHTLIIGDDVPAGCVGWADFEATGSVDFPAPELDPNEAAVMIFTSGTTSDPKGVLHSHNSLLAEMRASQMRLDRKARSIVLSPWPAGHIAGVLGVLRLYFTGGESVLMDAWDPHAAAALIEEYRVTSSSGTPYFITSMLDAAEQDGRDLSSLETYMVGAANVPPEVVERCERLGIVTYRSYGSSEHPTISSGNPDDPPYKRANTDGQMLAGCEVRIVDDEGNDVPSGHDGEIVAIGPEQFLGYHQPDLNADAFYPGGWFKTGDIGRVDEDGYLTITDRKKDIIIRGGENIASKEVEDILARHAAVTEVAVTAMPDERLGEKVCAYVVLKPGAQLDLEAVRAHFVACKVARQKTPERLELVADLPRTASGKVKKFELRAQLREEVDE